MNEPPQIRAQGVDRPERSAFARWAYLVFFAFILIGPAFNTEAGLWGWVLEIAVVTLALPTYVLSELRGWTRGGAVALMTLALAATPFNSAAISVLPIYAAALTATRGSREQVLRRLAIITIATLAGIAFSPVPWPYRAFFLVAVIMIWVIGLSVFEDVELAAHADTLRAENQRIGHLATMAERERIARDLHDLAGHALTAIVLRAQIIQRLAAKDPDHVTSEAQTIELMARDTLRSVRETVAGWHQASMSDELDLATKSLRTAGVDVEVAGDWGLDLAPSVETVMAMALRESVTNIVRHADAGRVVLRLDSPNGGVRMTVSDDGIGRSIREGSGLRGMRERVTAVGGTMELATRAGTTVTLEIPFGGRAT